MADDKKPFLVFSPLKHDGKLYKPAEGKKVTVQLTDDEADVLKGLKIVGEVSAESAKAEVKAETSGAKPKK